MTRIMTWREFKTALLSAFHPPGFYAKLKEQLQMWVQGPQENICNFAYNYRALCMKWKPDISEEMLVQRILDCADPQVTVIMWGVVRVIFIEGD